MAQIEQICLEEVCSRLVAVEAAMKEAALEEVWSRLVAVEAASRALSLEAETSRTTRGGWWQWRRELETERAAERAGAERAAEERAAWALFWK